METEAMRHLATRDVALSRRAKMGEPRPGGGRLHVQGQDVRGEDSRALDQGRASLVLGLRAILANSLNVNIAHHLGLRG